ncbi:MAG: xanthine dehydrogenase family protein subunit M [Deltaproteobacteria bacterium]|nr:xanthine dehydrogenase family protein subunit M [Deltaproteobacteria bacterium]
MKPFAYQAPTSLREAAALLGQPDLRVRAMAGGTDLLVQLRAGRFDLDLIVDIKGIEETNRLSYDPVEGLTIGAAVPCCLIYEDRQVQNLYPAIVDSASLIGGVAVQGRATIGGNVCNAAPSGDSLPTLMVLGARCRIFGLQGERLIGIEQFFTGPGTNVLGPGELLVSLQVPPPVPNSGARYLRFIPRNEMDIAVAGVGARVDLSDDLQKIISARIALGAVSPTPILIGEAGDTLIGQVPNEEIFSKASAIAQEAARPITDMRGTVAYRRHLVEVLVKRALMDAVDRARSFGKGKIKEVETHGR